MTENAELRESLIQANETIQEIRRKFLKFSSAKFSANLENYSSS